MKKTNILIVIASAIILSGCSTSPSRAALMIRYADINGVSDCEYLGPVRGTSGWGGIVNGVGINNAENEALNKAARIGATHIVNKNASGGWGSTFLADAYRCY